MNEPCKLRESVMACEGHALVIGGPGSGKDGAKLMQLIVSPTYAVKLSDKIGRAHV